MKMPLSVPLAVLVLCVFTRQFVAANLLKLRQVFAGDLPENVRQYFLILVAEPVPDSGDSLPGDTGSE
jgi:hypothetical protein